MMRSGGTESNKLHTLVVILPQHPVYHASSLILNSINLQLRTEEEPYRLMVFNSHGDSVDASAMYEKRALLAVLKEPVGGVIIWNVGGESTLSYIAELRKNGVPVVFVDRRPPGISSDFVGVHNRESAADAVRYLISLGHRRIAHITTTELSSPVIDRKQGYLDALLQAGIAPRPEWICTTSDVVLPDLRPAVRQFFEVDEPPTAVFALNDAIAHYFIAEAEAAGRKIPGAMSVIGFDDLEGYSPRPALLTTMHQPFDKIGQRATQLLLRRLHLARPVGAPYHVALLPAPLVVRSTCMPAPHTQAC